MFGIYTATRYLLYHRWADVRKSFDGLSGIVTNELRMPLQLGDVFIFLNKRRTHIKLLQWEGTAIICITSAWKKAPSSCRYGPAMAVIASVVVFLRYFDVSERKNLYYCMFTTTLPTTLFVSTSRCALRNSSNGKALCICGFKTSFSNK